MIVKTLLFAGIIVMPIHYFLVQVYIVDDTSLTPLYNKGDVLLVNRLPYYFATMNRGDVIVYRDSSNNSVKHISRIIALPGEEVTVSDGILTVIGTKKLTYELPLFGTAVASLNSIGKLDEHEYFVMGKQNTNSATGMLDIRFVVGKPWMKIWPGANVGLIK
jgi:signal peptidase I